MNLGPSWRRELLTERRMKDEFMARHPESPFVSSRTPFRPLRYFAPAPRWVVKARLDRHSEPEEAYLRTNRDGQAVVRCLGTVVFRAADREQRLKVYHAGEAVGPSAFVPFRDGTSGKESYGPGRYLVIDLRPDDRYELDFNRAFNPYCAYTDDFECGFPPAENDLPFAVRAGEKVWDPARNPATPSTAVKRMVEDALARRRTPRSGRGSS